MTMTSIRWTLDLSVGLPDIDHDHQKLITLLNEVFAASLAGVGDQHVEKILDELVAYTRYHFDREERMLADCGYPALDRHQEEHCRLCASLAHYCDRAREELAEGISAKVLDFLRQWLVVHILDHDKGYSGYCGHCRSVAEPVR